MRSVSTASQSGAECLAAVLSARYKKILCRKKLPSWQLKYVFTGWKFLLCSYENRMPLYWTWYKTLASSHFALSWATDCTLMWLLRYTHTHTQTHKHTHTHTRSTQHAAYQTNIVTSPPSNRPCASGTSVGWTVWCLSQWLQSQSKSTSLLLLVLCIFCSKVFVKYINHFKA